MKRVMSLYLLILTFFPGIFHQSFCQTIYLSGKVLESGSGSPVSNATIRIINADSNYAVYNLTSNRLGQYRFDSRRLRSFRIEVSKTPYETYRSGAYNIKNIITSRQYNLPDIVLKVAAPTHPDDVSIGPKNNPTPTKTESNKPEKIVINTPTRTVVKNRITHNRIYHNQDVYDLIYALNPGLDPEKVIPENYSLVMPKFPPLSRSKRKAFKKVHKAAVKSSGQEAAKFLTATDQFSDLVTRFSTATTSSSGNTVTSAELARLKESMSSLQRGISRFRSKAKKTSKATITLMGKEINLLNGYLQNFISSKSVTRDAYSQCLNLASQLEHFIGLLALNMPAGLQENYLYYVKINDGSDQLKDKDFRAVRVTGITAYVFTMTGLYNLSSVTADIKEHTTGFYSRTNDPRPFNIYVFIDDPNSNKPRDTPEEDLFDLTYYPPDLTDLSEKPGNLPASTATASIPPAKFTFLIEDTRTHNKVVCEKFLDAEKGKDYSVGWSLFRKRPYKLVFYLKLCK